VTQHEFAYILSISCLLTLDSKVHGIVCMSVFYWYTGEKLDVKE